MNFTDTFIYTGNTTIGRENETLRKIKIKIVISELWYCENSAEPKLQNQHQ